MTLRVDEPASEVRVIDRFDGGVGWIAHPEEAMQRASHALVVDDEVWVIDPVDADELDDLLAEYGDVAGVVVLLERHTRDAAAVAERHGVPVYLPDWFEGAGEEFPAETPIARFGAELSDTGLEAHVLKRSRFWQEVALYDPDRGTLVVPETLGTADFYLAGDERLGVHPVRRAFPPRERLESFGPDVERILVGHGTGITTDASSALWEALSRSRSGLPRLALENLRAMAPL